MRFRPGCASRTGCPSRSSRPRRRRRAAHDENIDAARAIELVGRERYEEVERTSLELYRYASEHAAAHGILVADTKFEFGLDADGRLILADEAFTPDSSRFWPADEYAPGGPQPSFDKQFVRDYCESLGWDKTAPGPDLPEDVVAGTRARYVDAFERLTGIPSPTTSPTRAWCSHEVASARSKTMRATVLVRPKQGILDPQGDAVQNSLRHLGFAVGDARVGRVVDLEVEAGDPASARAEVERMCEQLLANPLIESYEIEIDAP